MRSVITVLSVFVLLAAACVEEPRLDKGKFAELNRTAQDLRSAINSGKRCEFPNELLERLASGTEALKSKVDSKPERDLLSAYSNLLAMYKDGLFLCQSRTHLTDFKFVPKGRIYVSQELDPIVDRYDLPVERHQYKPTGSYWRSIPEDSIGVVWERAEAEIKSIENMVKSN